MATPNTVEPLDGYPLTSEAEEACPECQAPAGASCAPYCNGGGAPAPPREL